MRSRHKIHEPEMPVRLANHSSNALFPAGLVDQTLKSLALLFSRGDGEVEK